MFNVLGDVNWTGVLAAFIALVLLGGVWFAFLFSKPYNISLGRMRRQSRWPLPCSPPARR